jgi:hypothetical protein
LLFTNPYLCIAALRFLRLHHDNIISSNDSSASFIAD